MKHLGDITQIHSKDIPTRMIPDVLVGGSPCQDLSVAGKRAGLAGERSGLFMEQVRIFKELRDGYLSRRLRSGATDVAIRPRYLVWENVKGAFSSPGGSHKGEDFAAVLEELIKVCEPGAADLHIDVPKGGWTKSGCYYADDGSWSLAWTVHNAAEWCVPQRRERISLVLDAGGSTAPEILFVREGSSRNHQTGNREGQGASGRTDGGTPEHDRSSGDEVDHPPSPALFKLGGV